MKNKINYLLTLVLVALGLSSQAWAYEFKNPYIYFNNSNLNWNPAMLLVGHNKDNGYSYGYDQTANPVPNTKLVYFHPTADWTDQDGFTIGAASGWGEYKNKKFDDRANELPDRIGLKYSFNFGWHNTYYVTGTNGSSKTINVEYCSGGYSDLHKTQTVMVMISTDNGATYTEASSNWYSNSVKATRYLLTDYSTTSQTDKTLTKDDKYASAVLTSSITFTATPNSDFTFAGWSNSNAGPDNNKKDAAYTYTVTGTKTIYAYFNEKVSTITLVGCTEASTTAGPITTGTATAKEPAGKEVTGFEKSGEEITFTGAMADKAISFNATAAGTVTAVFGYKTPVIEHTGTASFQIGGAAIKLNPTYTDIADDATYTWSGTGVTFSATDVPNPNVSVATAGDYSITVTVTQGDKEASKNITLTASAFSGAECGTCFQHTAQ